MAMLPAASGLGLAAPIPTAIQVSARANSVTSPSAAAHFPFRDAPTVEYGLLWPATGNTPKVRAFVRTLLETAALRQGAA
ncbi:hypothetical protein [Streptomyces parvus]|uniref:hypothetical protein n=1 Tax=Streptomyces parvus TaxID=66428 RepID=UPI001653E7DA|nr:hypothetical protein [Streptomyces parvus]